MIPKLNTRTAFQRTACLLMALYLWFQTTSAPAQPAPLCFFTHTADRLIRYSTAQWCAQDFKGFTNTFGGSITAGFSLTNIPVQINGAFVYSPAVNRLLQLAANVYDATTTNFYPSVFRPTFFCDASGNVFINGYQQVVSVTGPSDSQLTGPREVGSLPAGCSTNSNVYGVPWIIGAKKYLPNFNQFYMQEVVQVTRLLQVSRKVVEPWTRLTTSDFATNVLYVMSISNQVGYSLWNSYATNYPGGSPTVLVSDTMLMTLSNGAASFSGAASFNFSTNVSAWPGARWDLTLGPSSRQAAQGSFIYANGSYSFLPPSAYQFNPPGLVPLNSLPPPNYDTSIVTLPVLPAFSLVTTNWLYAYILDGSNVIDYVQFHSLGVSRNLNDQLSDVYVNGTINQMWVTNVAVRNGGNQGILNQISLSQIGPPQGSSTVGWVAPGNLPPGLQLTPQNEADYFRAFFTGTPFIANGQTYYNTELTNQAPYRPMRTIYDLTLWQANDPLVHYMVSDLTESNPYTGIHHTDDALDNPPATVIQNALGHGATQIGDDRYQPWGRIAQLAQLNNVDSNAYNLSYRDPLVYSSDDWDFPTHASTPLDWLGRVHRGTPWQTVYLKSTNILALISGSIPNGPITWSAWTGDGNPDDASWSAPINDWRLASLLTSMLNTNDLSTLLSVNNPDTNAWQATLDGLAALTNSTASPNWFVPSELDPLLISSNSSPAAIIASAIESVRTSQSEKFFANVGDVLSVPALSTQSPFLNTTASPLLDYGISDEAYEKIPSQLLSRLRADSIGSVTVANGQLSVSFTGYDGHTYEIQTSTDLVHWNNLGTSQPANGIFGLTTPVSATGPPQFYRTLLLQ